MKKTQLKSYFVLPLFIFIVIFSIHKTVAQNGVNKKTELLQLGETAVKINIYEKKGSEITFVSLHHNEQTAIKVIKQIIEKNGGRFIELESVNETGIPLRRLRFSVGGRSHNVDPNRIFTDNGRLCSNQTAPEIAVVVKTFADALLKIMLPPNGKTLPKNEKFLVALHNNADINDETRTPEEKEKDLTAFTFIRGNRIQFPLAGANHDQVEGVFISNWEVDEDNFFFITTPIFMGFLAEKGFNVVLQKPAAKLQTTNCLIDDGSLSVYFGQQNIPYINVEADARTGEFRQKQMIEAIYDLSKVKD